MADFDVSPPICSPLSDSSSSDPHFLRDAFAATLRRQRARQHAVTLSLKWQPRWCLKDATPRLIGAEAQAAQALWVSPGKASAKPLGRGRHRTVEQARRDLDEEVLELACHEAFSWAEPLRLMVPLTDPHGPTPQFLPRLDSILKRKKISPACLDVVIHEASLARENSEVAYVLALLRDQGVGIWLNRFGQDVSSMSLLRDRARSGVLSGVCLDGEALLKSSMFRYARKTEPAHDPFEPENRCFVRGMIASIHALGLQVRLMGVEDATLLDFAVQSQCDEASGSYAALENYEDAFQHIETPHCATG
ncbi:EAL domain-containing protein [Kozakia baliensis]|uniref:EAL domain-containing protein n=1 Tax=Kozakia baliensis TaxID=153496 RepID=UPI00345C29C9